MRRRPLILLVLLSLLAGLAEASRFNRTRPLSGQVFLCGDDSVSLIDVQSRRADPIFTQRLRFFAAASIPADRTNAYKVRWNAPSAFAKRN